MSTASLYKSIRSVYEFAPERFDELRKELGQTELIRIGNFALSKLDPVMDAVWARNVWSDVHCIQAASISGCVDKLRALKRKWHRAHAGEDLNRRSALIEDELPRWRRPVLKFPGELPAADWGNWMLLDRELVLAATKQSSPFLGGIARFEEPTHETHTILPPSQAYKKIWEGLSLLGKWPQKGEVCVDLGSSPGGWTWALLELGAEVHSVDRADLDPNLSKYPLISQRPFFHRADAFKFRPEIISKKVDWVFSDVICFPERLKEFMETWGKLNPRPNLMFTLKFQGETNFEILNHFRSIPNSFMRHLSVNKHEVTWINLRN